MGRSKKKTVLFLCTGNYYRSRFAENLFNSVVKKLGLSWHAESRGLALERGVNNLGPMALSAIEACRRQGIAPEGCARLPLQAVAADFENADLIVAVKEAEHRPLLQERFPAWTEKVEYWHVDDAEEALGFIERAVMELTARLLGGGRQAIDSAAEERTCPDCGRRHPAGACQAVRAAAKTSPVVRVGRETKGRRGKGVTTIADLPLDEDQLAELAAQLKRRCGTGGTVKEGRIEIQGDQRERVSAELASMGYRVKRAGS